MKLFILGLILTSSVFASIQTVELTSKEINLGTFNTLKGKAANKTIVFKRSEFSPRKTKVNYFVAVKKYMCVEWEDDYSDFPYYLRQNCIKTEAYFVKKKKHFDIEFTYTVPLLRGESETYEVQFTQKHIETKKVSFEVLNSETVRVYEFDNKKNKLEAYIDAVRRLDFWW